MKRLFAAAIVTGLLICPSAAFGQTAFARIWVDVDFGVAYPAEKEFTAATSFVRAASNTGEPSTFSTIYSLPAGATFGAGGGFMLNKKLGFGVNISGSSHEDFAELTARVPHPNVFNTYGTGSGPTDRELLRSELGIHIQVMFVALDTGKLRIRVFGGPSYLTVKQSMIDNFTWVQTVSFTAPFTNTIVIAGNDAPVDVEASTWGVNVGGDVTYFFTKAVGVGGFVRYVGGSVDLDNVLDGTGTVKSKAGGVQLGGGLRLRF